MAEQEVSVLTSEVVDPAPSAAKPTPPQPANPIALDGDVLRVLHQFHKLAETAVTLLKSKQEAKMLFEMKQLEASSRLSHSVLLLIAVFGIGAGVLVYFGKDPAALVDLMKTSGLVMLALLAGPQLTRKNPD